MPEVTAAIGEMLHIPQKEAELILEKAITGGEITESFSDEDWFGKRFLPNIVKIDETGYAKMCIDALKILNTTAASDYGSSRQRDMGQLWADMTRGYLGELAFVKFLKLHGNIDAELNHEHGELEQYLPMDIHKIKKDGKPQREPRLKISVKAAKWNGIWFDIPGAQFSHSDVHVLVKVGAGRDHLFSFFKNLSVFKDKVLKRGVEVGSLSQSEAGELYEKIPSFSPIPAYICGFVRQGPRYSSLDYDGRKGRMHYNITSWNGPIKDGDLDEIKRREQVSGHVKFEGIGEFSHDNGYLFNTGKLQWKPQDWESVFNEI